MLTRAEDYVCVDTTGFSSSVVTGDILPMRDNRGDGSWRAVRYEDLLFLQEAKAERRLCAQSALPGTREAPKGRALDWDVFWGVVPSGQIDFRTVTESGGWFMDAKIAVPSTVVSCGAGENPFAVAMPGAFSTVWNDYTPTYEPLSVVVSPDARALGPADVLRRAYYNVLRQTRSIVYAPGRHYGSNPAVMMTHMLDGTSSGPVDMSDSQYLYSVTAAYRGRGSTFIGAAWMPPQSLGRYVFARSATLLVWLYWEGPNLTEGYDLVPFTCQVGEGGLISMPQVDAGGLASGVCGRHGIPYYATDPGYLEPGSSGGAVSFRRMALIIDHGFPAEIGSLNWNWQPAGSE